MSKERVIDIDTGLSIEEVEKRYQKNLVNYDTTTETKSIKEIIKSNILTLFNIINIILALAIISVGSFKNLAFMIIIIANTTISIFQEIRSKKTLDKLQVTVESKIVTRREGVESLLNINEIVKDDIIMLKAGNQVVVDSIIRKGNIEVDESFITGESDTIYKKEGDHILSGSFIVSGTATCQVEHIGEENYTAKLAKDAKNMKTVSSEIMKSLDNIVKTISVLIVPLAILLFYRQLYLSGNNITNAVVNTTAALIGMIPEGLILLTSTVLAASVYVLSKKEVLVQDLYCIETLARVDTLCLDKTGTLTKGELEVVKEEKVTDENTEEIISLICESTEDDNPTAIALRKKYHKQCEKKVQKTIPFSSKRKYSGVVIEDKTYLIGAPEFILEKEQLTKYQEKIDEYSKKYRLLILVSKKEKKTKILSFILMQDKLRENVKETLDFFKRQGVELKIISGDNPLTVKNIAKRAGMNQLKEIDATKITSDEELISAVEGYNIFGRVTPLQKRDFVIALQNSGHTVAMTGDGVNDILALKEADCSIAMASGSDATKNVSELILLNSDFESMPYIVAEGRRTINNIERSSSLFLVKTVYATILSILFVFIEKNYPFIPIQLTLASAATIGIPSFLLSFEPNEEKVEGKFLPNVLKKVIPPALTIVTIILIITYMGDIMKLSYEETSTLSVFMTGSITFMLLYKICKPLNRFRIALIITMVTIFMAGFIMMKDIFSFANLNFRMVILGILGIIASALLYETLEKYVPKIKSKNAQIKETMKSMKKN